MKKGGEKMKTKLPKCSTLDVTVWDVVRKVPVDRANVVVFNQHTMEILKVGVTNNEGRIEIPISKGEYVMWIYGHNPVGYRPFLSDTWLCIQVGCCERKCICTCLVSIVDIPALYKAVKEAGDHWKRSVEIFEDIIKNYVEAGVTKCKETAHEQHMAAMEMFKEPEKWVLVDIPKETNIKLRKELIAATDNWRKEIKSVLIEKKLPEREFIPMLKKFKARIKK